MTDAQPLQGSVVTELGGREAVGICGMLLAQLGATVIVLEPTGAARPRDASRALFTAGKHSLSFDADSHADSGLLARLIARSDVVLTSSDVDAPALRTDEPHPANIVCDITACGARGPGSDERLTEWQVEAISGVMDTTGLSDGPPLPIGVPILNYAAAAYATASVLAALRVRRMQGIGQRVEASLFDAGFVALSNFLVDLRPDKPRSRTGNRHPAIAPWNAFRTSDGHVLIAAGSQAHWLRLCNVMEQPALADDYGTQRARLDHVEAVEAAIESWTSQRDTSDCVRLLLAAGVAAGPIAPIDLYPREANLAFRAMIRHLHDPLSGRDLFVPASPMALRGSPPVQANAIPAPGADRAEIERLVAESKPIGAVASSGVAYQRPLAGVRIVEAGQYTSAPLCARHLAHLGAEVIKIEKPGGDEGRSYAPSIGDLSEVFCMNNADKRSMLVDLRDPASVEVLKSLLRTADVLIENNKPGTLAKIGLSVAELAELNPGLVVCAISGFGAESIYGDRPGFDTVIQAISGFKTAVNPGGVPLKSGISSADMMGSLIGMVAILGALEYRDRTGRGQFIDLSMQDIGCWLTGTVWNTDLKTIPRPATLRCADGYVFTGATEADLTATLARDGLTRDGLTALNREDVSECLISLGLPAAPVISVREAAESPQTRERHLWFTLPAQGRTWPMLGCPLRLQVTPALVTRQAPGLNDDGPDILRELGRSADMTRAQAN